MKDEQEKVDVTHRGPGSLAHANETIELLEKQNMELHGLVGTLNKEAKKLMKGMMVLGEHADNIHDEQSHIRHAIQGEIGNYLVVADKIFRNMAEDDQDPRPEEVSWSGRMLQEAAGNETTREAFVRAFRGESWLRFDDDRSRKFRDMGIRLDEDVRRHLSPAEITMLAKSSTARAYFFRALGRPKTPSPSALDLTYETALKATDGHYASLRLCHILSKESE